MASKSIERYIEPVSGIDLPNSDMMSRKMADKSIVEHLEVSLRPLHPKGVAGKLEPKRCAPYVCCPSLTRWWNSPYLWRIAQLSYKGMDIRNHEVWSGCPISSTSKSLDHAPLRGSLNERDTRHHLSHRIKVHPYSCPSLGAYPLRKICNWVKREVNGELPNDFDLFVPF